MRRSNVLCAALACASVLGCGAREPEAISFGPPVASQGLAACVGDATDGVTREGFRCATYRAIGGVSMGGGSAMRIALEHPELFDVVTSLGAPYIDMEYFLLSVSKVSNGGFCPMERLLANLDRLDVKDDPATWCGPVPLDDLAIPGTRCTGGSGDFNHHYRGTAAGRGGSFDRIGSFEIVQDLALAYGNPAFYNPASPYLPPGVPLAAHVPLGLEGAERAAAWREICARPVVLEHEFDRTYNPRGEYPMITFCDGNGRENGVYEPGTNVFPVEVALAVDYNRNGRRDYAEPVIAQVFEPFDDLGPDGKASRDEPGFDPVARPDPAGDDYDWFANPSGTEGNSRPDPGERWEDVGLDGVAGTNDFGEGDGRFTLNPNVERAFARSPRRLVESMDARMLSRLHLWVDAGIRDFLFTAQITNQFWGALRRRLGPSQATLHDDWGGLAKEAGLDGAYDPTAADLSERAIGRNAYLRYGDPSICPGLDEATGRGNHVGPAKEILDRLMTALAFASRRWDGGDRRPIAGGLFEQGPTGAISDFVQVKSFASAALGREQPYVVILPPSYHRAPEARYPVMYFLHGQGQKASDLAASALLFLGPQMEGLWQKMIIVFADGECHRGECHTGTFYIDFQGVDGRGPRHEEAFFELMREIDARYRTKAPEMLPVAATAAGAGR